ncbi:MAG: alpha/beta hydrolase [Firmicutes bacterium]|nr:alpha/beta hydrolase [Bacillota bacterium]
MSSENTTKEYSLEFDPYNYTETAVTVDDKTVIYRSYESIVYVKYPVDTTYQIMNIYVPVEYYEKDQSINGYNAKTAPIFFPNPIGGYMPGTPMSPSVDFSGDPNGALLALSKGYVIAAPGARGRTTQADNGLYTGKAPACIVDLKSAVRYLRYNKNLIPGDTEKIVSCGTSAGGAASALLGATGNNKDYEPYLKAIGAAAERDDIFAAQCYCPITNLDNADTAYEWLFNGVNGTMTDDQITISDQLKSLFPAYVNSLGLNKGTELALDADGNGPFKNYVKSFLIASAQKALDDGTDLSDLTWITITDGTVTDIDFNEYAEYASRYKAAPAFDGLDLSHAENGLFGSATINAKHFTQFGMENSTVDSFLADEHIVKMLNPMNYIGAQNTDTAQYWRIRHGAVDRDTSIAIPVILATKLDNEGFNVDLAIPWGQGHGGDYDLDELFTWLDNICGTN